MLNFAKADTSGASYFPSNQFDPKADYGRSTFDTHQRFLLGGNYLAPFGISISPFLVTDSGSPFNITVGQDLNGDNPFNDRPAFATSSSTDVMNTRYGSFDLNPSAGETRIPYNFVTGPKQFSTNLRLSKSIGIGPRSERAASGGLNGPPPGGGGGRGPGGGGPPAAGLGPGGLSSSGGRPPMFDQHAATRYSLSFTAMGRNVFNNVNLATPVGVLESPLFGKSNALAGGFFSSPSSNRSIDFQVSFNFWERVYGNRHSVEPVGGTTSCAVLQAAESAAARQGSRTSGPKPDVFSIICGHVPRRRWTGDDIAQMLLLHPSGFDRGVRTLDA